MFARGYTFITGFEATFVLMRWHHVFSLFSHVCFCFRKRRVRKSAHNPGGRLWYGAQSYRGIWEDTGPPKTDPAESHILSHDQNTERSASLRPIPAHSLFASTCGTTAAATHSG